MILTQPQRNILRFMAHGRWAYIGLAGLFVTVAVVQWVVMDGTARFADYLWTFAMFVAALTQLIMFVNVALWHHVFKEHIDD